ncbi:hypothetical protein N9J11_01245 [Actinomycetota bacterium]|nr:hypothetical protein [Actinomycetota bacterium]
MTPTAERRIVVLVLGFGASKQFTSQVIGLPRSTQQRPLSMKHGLFLTTCYGRIYAPGQMFREAPRGLDVIEEALTQSLILEE